MTTRDDYMAVARELADYLNGFKLAFKTYSISELDSMIRAVAGEGARISTEAASADFENCLLQRGFVVYPAIANNREGYVRVYRASSLIGNLLSAFRYPGPNGDTELARLLTTLQRRRRPDDLDNEDA